MQFEAVSRFDPEEKKIIRSLLDGMIRKHEARRWSADKRGYKRDFRERGRAGCPRSFLYSCFIAVAYEEKRMVVTNAEFVEFQQVRKAA